MCRYLSLETEWPSLYDLFIFKRSFIHFPLLSVFFFGCTLHPQYQQQHLNPQTSLWGPAVCQACHRTWWSVSVHMWLATSLCLCRVLTERSLSRISHGPWICCEMRNMPIWMAFGNYTVHPQAWTGLCMNNWLVLEYLFLNLLVDQQIPSQTVQTLLFLWYNDIYYCWIH